jgi:DNA-binding CsgD family transcriptional regulator
MTPRQAEILSWVQNGLTNKQIAARMNITEMTVKFHITGLLKMYAARTRNQLALYSLSNSTPVLPKLEDNPYAWVKKNSHSIGITFINPNDDSWVAVYKKEQN